jgi:hypothetical protein
MTTANVYFQRILAGNRISGNAPNGVRTPTSPDSPTFGGVVEVYDDCTESGLFEFSKSAPRNGVSVLSIAVQGVGMTGFTLSMLGTSVPNAANSVPVFTVLTHQEQEFVEQALTVTNFTYVFKTPLLVPPGFDLRMQSQGNFTTSGNLMLTVGPGFGQPAGFVQVKSN